ncbi:MAG: hypothetical protein EXS39_00595 [Opitutaceae bacterium]|nr:hypothetical protein [Opitutaceae bacterium]
MKLLLRFLLVTGWLTAAAIPAHAKIERVVEKAFTVQPGGSLRVETQRGSISVQPSGDAMVRIIARERIRAGSDAAADELLKKLTLTLEQSGNAILASAKYEGLPAGFHFGSWPPVLVDFVVTAPADFATDLKTSGGTITTGDLAGKVHARTSGGNIKLGRISADVNAATSGGNVSLIEGTAVVKLTTSGGDIWVGRATGPAELSTSGGDIKIDSVENTLRASTSGGDVRAGITGAFKGVCTLRTSGGKVKATVDQGAGFHLDASTSGGDVNAAGLTITIEKGGQGKSRLSGDVNGGGPLLKLRSSGGDDTVQTR